jgi:hypothetical protein
MTALICWERFAGGFGASETRLDRQQERCGIPQIFTSLDQVMSFPIRSANLAVVNATHDDIEEPWRQLTLHGVLPRKTENVMTNNSRSPLREAFDDFKFDINESPRGVALELAAQQDEDGIASPALLYPPRFDKGRKGGAW